jgi:CubicO group peptidase (beta-lactamase class C family)
MTPRDLARIGEMMRGGGAVNGQRILPEDWIADTIHNGSAKAWQQSKSVEWLPKGRYRNKWYQTGEANEAFFALGIHGQWLYVDRSAEMVIAKFSSQPLPVSNEMKWLNLSLFDAVAKMI